MKSILIVDDEDIVSRTMYDLLRLCFNGKDVHVAVAASVREAWKTLEELEEVAIVIADVVMPKESGIDFIEDLRNSKEYRDTQIIAMSGYLNPTGVLKIEALGISGFLHKPFDTDEMLELVEKCLRRAEIGI